MKGLLKSEPEQEGRCVWIIRHGQTLLNKEDKIRAWLNVPLDETGKEQAEHLGKELKKESVLMDGLITSDLQRSMETAYSVSHETGIPVLAVNDCLRPLNVGTFSGTNGPEAHRLIMEAAKNHPDQAIGGGESFNTFRIRIIGGIIALLNEYHGKTLGLVSHSRGERALHAWVAKGCPCDLSVDLDEFGKKGEDTATAQELFIKCPLVLP